MILLVKKDCRMGKWRLIFFRNAWIPEIYPKALACTPLAGTVRSSVRANGQGSRGRTMVLPGMGWPSMEVKVLADASCANRAHISR